MHDREQIGQAIRRYRRAAGMSQEVLAERAGLPRTGLSSVEAGRQSLPLDTAARIADALGVTVSALLGETPAAAGPRRTFRFTRWSGREETVTATGVESAPGGALVFRDGDRLVLAVQRGDWNNVREVPEREHGGER